MGHAWHAHFEKIVFGVFYSVLEISEILIELSETETIRYQPAANQQVFVVGRLGAKERECMRIMERIWLKPRQVCVTPSTSSMSSEVEDIKQFQGNKPEMERRRRARMNQAFEQLKKFHLMHSPNQTSKLEKTDVLELTVEYLKNLHENVNNSPPQTAHCQCLLPPTLSQHCACINRDIYNVHESISSIV
ncbi:unnamed protein product [Anisakis simplex]|uniref:BHLH domain-containing protein n=1 Tax=Anisakis simplex TaxID=6269 RepID=A0A0M3KF17_ANISI|nr:unnamed protein product [Anisakis simplex]